MKVDFYQLFLFSVPGVDISYSKSELDFFESMLMEMTGKVSERVDAAMKGFLFDRCFLHIIDSFPFIADKSLIGKIELIKNGKENKDFKDYQIRSLIKEKSDSFDKEFDLPVLSKDAIIDTFVEFNQFCEVLKETAIKELRKKELSSLSNGNRSHLVN